MQMSIGLDIGGTNISAVISNNQGEIFYSCTRKSDYYGNQYIKNIEELIGELLERGQEDICGIGIGVPGTVDYNKGMVIACPAFNWNDLLLKDHFEKVFGIRTTVDNDVNAWTLAEKKVGAARHYDNFAMVTIGTGIGCGLYLGGNIYRGHSYEAGEIGYLPLGIEAYNKTHLQNDFGFFESKASALATSKAYQSITERAIDCKDIFDLAKNGDTEAAKVVDEVYQYLGLGISSVICVINPQIVVIGGGMAQEGEGFLNIINKKVKQLTPLNAELSLTKTGEYGGAIGCALSVFE